MAPPRCSQLVFAPASRALPVVFPPLCTREAQAPSISAHRVGALEGQTLDPHHLQTPSAGTADRP